MKTRLIVTVASLLLALDAFAQRTDLSINDFQPFSGTQKEIQGGYLVLITSSTESRGAHRCVDLQGPLRFGGIGFVPSRNRNGQPNHGAGRIALVPYTQPGCSGTELPRMDAPPFGDSSPRDVDFPMVSTGDVPANAKSARFFISMIATSTQPFQFCFRSPWLEQTGAPDLDPDVVLFVGNLFPNPPGSFSLEPVGKRMVQGDTLPRGRLLMMYVDVKNVGTGAALSWMVTARIPQNWKFGTPASNCKDFNASGIHNATAALGPGEEKQLCATLMPNAPAAAVRVSAETSVANDANPANNSASSEFFEVEALRNAAPLPQNVLNHLDGRKK